MKGWPRLQALPIELFIVFTYSIIYICSSVGSLELKSEVGFGVSAFNRKYPFIMPPGALTTSIDIYFVIMQSGSICREFCMDNVALE